MILVCDRLRASLRAVMLIAVAGVLAACGENLESSAACPALCPEQTSRLQNVTLDAVTLDTTVRADVGLGSEPFMLLASRGDTLDSRVVIRFDSLPATVAKSATDGTPVAVTSVDSVNLMLRIDSGAVKAGVPITLEAYDVDTTAADTLTSALTTLFRPDRLITSQQFAPGAFVDSINFRLPSAPILAKIKGGKHLRLGLRLAASASVQARVYATESSRGPHLSLRLSPDTAIKPVVLVPFSQTPADNAALAGALADYSVLVKGTPEPPPSLLAVGGLPGRRIYFRFKIPPSILDSATVVRATLVLTQQPGVLGGVGDTLFIQPLLGVAGAAISDPARAAQIVASPAQVALALAKVLPRGSGVVSIEIVPAITAWHFQTATGAPDALILASAQEGSSPLEALFYSVNAADPALRPKLSISYTPNALLGIP